MSVEKPSFNFEEIDSYSSEQEKLQWKGDFSEYLENIVENPSLVRSSRRLLYESVTSKPDFFQTGQNALYGAEKTTEKLLDVLHGGAQGLEVGKRIILLMGPPGSGKSTLVNGLKRGLEQYSKTDEGAVYAIEDCPMQEEPLHLIPKEMRPKFEENFNIHIEGELCPHCNAKYGENAPNEEGKSYGERLSEVPVKRIIMSEKDRVGIGTFKPSDPKSQDITELVGSVDFSKLAEYGTASDPRAYRFDGELNVANRGMVEFVEMLKSDEKFLYALLDLTQDKAIKAPRFPNIYADEVVVAHTNEHEYAAFTQGGKNEALKDRMVVIPVPYNLKVSAERKIYEKLINQSELSRRSNIHINPLALDVAANFAVLSRLEHSKKPNVSKMQKLKLYDGQDAHDLTQRDLKELQEEFPREGMSGISPRYVIDSLSLALIAKDRECLTPIDTIRTLRDNIENHPHTRDLKPEEKAAILTNLTAIKEEYDEVAKKEVQSAFVYSYEEQARTLSDNYLANVEAYTQKTKIVDPITEEETAPDERLMRSIEEQIGISENGKAEFRNELLVRIGALALRGEVFDHKAHPRLNEAIEKKLFADMKDVIKMTTSAKVPNQDQQKRLSEVQKTLMEDKGYCEHCSKSLVEYVGTLLAK